MSTSFSQEVLKAVSVLTPQERSRLTADEISRRLNIQAEIGRRKAVKERAERLLLKSAATEKVMYVVAYESMTETGFLYTHASNWREAQANIYYSGSLRNYRIVSVAPVVGAHSTDGKVAHLYG